MAGPYFLGSASSSLFENLRNGERRPDGRINTMKVNKGIDLMKKIILNACTGGYWWSWAAVLDYIDRIDATPEFKQETRKRIHGGDIDREDPVAIQLLEEKGSKYCSDYHADLVVEEYDDELFEPIIHEYDGAEALELRPCIAESRIRECSTIDEVIELLKQVNVMKTA